VNVLKRSCEDDRVAVWAEPDQATDVIEVTSKLTAKPVEKREQ